MLIVQKFGGSSVADPEKVRRVAGIIADTYCEGHDVVVVLSAQGKTTDHLIEMARQINENYRAACGGNAPRWEELSAFLRRSNMASANHLRTKLRYLLDDDSLTEFTQAQLRQAYDRFRELPHRARPLGPLPCHV